jgi:DNA-directed RNA polymerase subunit beta
MTENIDYGDGDLTPLIEGDNNFRYDEDYTEAGYRETTAEEEESFFDSFDEESVELSEMDDDLED